VADAVTLPESRHDSQDAVTGGVPIVATSIASVRAESAPLTGIRLAVNTRPNKLHKARAPAEWWMPGSQERQNRLLENDRRRDGAALIR
jgi:hypothetical protein